MEPAPAIDMMRRALRTFVNEAGGKGDVARVARHFDMPSGRKWDEIPDADIERLYRFTLGGERLIGTTPDDSPEGKALNQHLDDIKF